MKTNAWFLLYGGTSADGRGPGNFLKRTECPSEARTHYEKCRENPYSVGRVDIVTDDCIERAGMLTDWSAYSIAEKRDATLLAAPFARLNDQQQEEARRRFADARPGDGYLYCDHTDYARGAPGVVWVRRPEQPEVQ